MTTEQKDKIKTIIVAGKKATRSDWDYVKSVVPSDMLETVWTKQGVKYRPSVLLLIDLGLA